MNILSLFDGMSCGQIALNRLGIKYDSYYASEIKKNAIKVTQHNYPSTIQLGDITKIDGYSLPKIDLLIGGSPCQDFSVANSIRSGLKGTKSKLFYEYVRLLKETNPQYFLLENVIMDKIGYNTISDILGIEPIRINGSKVSAALRDRLYWTNIGPKTVDLFGHKKSAIPQPTDKKIKLNDILEYGYSNKKKHTCLTTNCGVSATQRYMIHRFNTTGMTTIIYKDKKCNINDGVRYCTQLELERLHNIPEGYTNCLNKYQAGNLIGDGWTIDVITHILNYIS